MEDPVGAIEQVLMRAAGLNTIVLFRQLLTSLPRNLPGDTS